ncbi:MAG: DUF1761 domain-containing protein [Patescibacteria group bacterium]
MFFQNINYWVVIAAAIIGMIVGFLWHAPWAFGPLWMKSKGWTEESMRAKKAGKSMAPVWVGMTAVTFITAFVIAAIFNSLVVVSFWGIILTAFLLWIGFAVPMKLADYYFGGDNFVFFLLSVGHELAVLIVMSAIIGIFG